MSKFGLLQYRYVMKCTNTLSTNRYSIDAVFLTGFEMVFALKWQMINLEWYYKNYY